MKKFLLILGLVGLFTSCVTVGTLSYDRLQAADINFPEMVRRVGVVNNMPPSSVVEERSTEWLEGDGTITAESFAQAIAATDYFEEVVLCDSSLYHSSLQGEGAETLSSTQVDSLIKALDVDMLFSLNRVYIHLKENSFFLPGVQGPVTVIDGIVTPKLQVYVPNRSTPLFSIAKTDSIYWDLSPSLDVKQVVADASEFAATIPMKHLLPYWEEVSRYYYNGGDVHMRDAAVSVQEGDWDSAYQLWEQAYQQKKGAARMRAAYNMALYYEMHDDFERAKTYLSEALQLAKEGSSEKNMMEFYQVQLNNLAATNSKLKIQMKRFDNKF